MKNVRDKAQRTDRTGILLNLEWKSFPVW